MRRSIAFASLLLGLGLMWSGIRSISYGRVAGGSIVWVAYFLASGVFVALGLLNLRRKPLF